VQQYREGPRDLRAIGQTLRVSAVLQGSVQRSGGRVRISAHLLDTSSGRQLWSEHYDRELVDTFAIQTEVALDIARTLGITLTSAEKTLVQRLPTKDREAHALYLRANYYLNRGWAEDDNQKAKELLEMAVSRDPSFAAGHALLSIAITSLNRVDCDLASSAWGISPEESRTFFSPCRERLATRPSERMSGAGYSESAMRRADSGIFRSPTTWIPIRST
jgi:hypothetical protein